MPAVLAQPLGQAQPWLDAGHRQPPLLSSGTRPEGQARHAVPPAPNRPVVTRSIDSVKDWQCRQGRVASRGVKLPAAHFLQLRALPGALVAP